MDDGLSLLVVGPHPDDESISCGGVLALAAEEGIATAVVTCTGGEQGDNLAGIDLGDEDLPTHRRRELADALEALGVTEHVWLGYRDSGMAGTVSNDHADSFHLADLDEAALRLAAVFRRLRPHVVISDDEAGSYGHPDHIKAHLVTRRAVALAADGDVELPGAPWTVLKRYVHAFSRTRLRRFHEGMLEAGLASPFGDAPIGEGEETPFGVPEEAITTVVDISPVLDRKQQAMRAHRSQLGEDSFFLNLPRDLELRTMAVEEFVLEETKVPRVGRETDLFTGLRAEGRAAAGQ